MSDFITDFPALLKYWNFDSNIKLEIEKLAITSKKHVSWKCPNCSYEWKASVAKSYKQVLNHTKICPVCDLGEVLVKGENAMSEFAKLAQDFVEATSLLVGQRTINIMEVISRARRLVTVQ